MTDLRWFTLLTSAWGAALILGAIYGGFFLG